MHPLLQFTLDFFEPPKLLKPALSDEAPHALPVPGPSTVDVTYDHPRANREVRLNAVRVAYEFKRGNRRTIGFSVGLEGLVVRAPKWVTRIEIESALQEKSLWILRKLGETRERRARVMSNRIEWRNGTTVPFLGEPVTVVLDPWHPAGKAGAELTRSAEGHTLFVVLPHAATPDQIREAVRAWLFRQARQRFIERLDHFAPQLQVQWRTLTLSNAGTRWGSARVDGAIRLNWRLIHFRPPVIDYVVAHELSHLRVMNHSPRFWETVRSVVPDYASLREQLNDEAAPRWQ